MYRLLFLYEKHGDKNCDDIAGSIFRNDQKNVFILMMGKNEDVLFALYYQQALTFLV